jgi:ABC-type uncharacterized transport system auxiliary subunit
MGMNRITALSLAGMIVLALAACSGLLTSDQPPARTYWLEPFAGQPENAPSLAGGLAVTVGVVPGLDSDRLLTLGPDSGMSHISGARWPDYLPEFAASLMQRSLRASGPLDPPASDEEDVQQHDCLLELLFQRFYTRLDRHSQPVSVEVGVAASLDCGDRQFKVQLDENPEVNGARVADVVAAHQEALDRISRQLWALLDEPVAVQP